MKKFITLIGLCAIFGSVIYLDSSTNLLLDDFRTSVLYPYAPEEVKAEMAEEVDAQAQENDENALIPSLELLYENEEEIDGYIVETYREYEIYSDEKGNKIKQVPTSHFEYIRYKK
ncbi:hypothetical protein [Neobacillus sp. D3-1R]|uniref:hypothetical protein n=1 Tax=Neobacillus sp. D3-1R TaxID=3445778 RepID=UPI003F9FACBF